MVSLSFLSLIYFNFVCADSMMKRVVNANLLSVFVTTWKYDSIVYPTRLSTAHKGTRQTLTGIFTEQSEWISWWPSLSHQREFVFNETVEKLIGSPTDFSFVYFIILLCILFTYFMYFYCVFLCVLMRICGAWRLMLNVFLNGSHLPLWAWSLKSQLYFRDSQPQRCFCFFFSSPVLGLQAHTAAPGSVCSCRAPCGPHPYAANTSSAKPFPLPLRNVFLSHSVLNVTLWISSLVALVS